MATVELTKILNEVLDFLVSAPTPEQIIALHASDSAKPATVAAGHQSQR